LSPGRADFRNVYLKVRRPVSSDVNKHFSQSVFRNNVLQDSGPFGNHQIKLVVAWLNGITGKVSS
jgi:hypothetical protein